MVDVTEARWIELGRVSGVHGVRGGLKVESWTRPKAAIADHAAWHLGDERRPFRLARVERRNERPVVFLEGVEDRDTAEALVGKSISVTRNELPEPDAGSWYWADLEGLAVRTVDGIELGTVRRLVETGAHDVMVIDGDRERLVPFAVGPVVRKVDLDTGNIVVDWHPDD